MIFQDPSKPQASRNFTQRYLLRLNGIAPEIIDIMCPLSPGEMDAKNENQLLSRNISSTLLINDDHLSHMIIHSSAEDTNAKFAHIEAHKRAYITSGQMEKDMLAKQEAMKSLGGVANQSMNQMSNQAVQQQSVGAERSPIENGVN
jgi:hypothetical protein